MYGLQHKRQAGNSTRPEKLKYGEFAVSRNGGLYVGDESGNVKPACGEWEKLCEVKVTELGTEDTAEIELANDLSNYNELVCFVRDFSTDASSSTLESNYNAYFVRVSAKIFGDHLHLIRNNGGSIAHPRLTRLPGNVVQVVYPRALYYFNRDFMPPYRPSQGAEYSFEYNYCLTDQEWKGTRIELISNIGNNQKPLGNVNFTFYVYAR